MSITINGTGTITGISSGGLPDGVITTDDLANNAVTTAKLGTNEQSGLCRAWVNFNGTGTVAIRASFNVSSITDNGTGDYTVNFTTAMVDANYSAIALGGNSAIAATDTIRSLVSKTFASSSLRVMNCRTDSVAADIEIVSVAIFR